MQVKPGFHLRKSGGNYVAVPTGALSAEFNGMLRMDEAGKFLFEKISQDTTPEAMAQALTAERGVEPEKARQDVEAFVKNLADANLLK